MAMNSFNINYPFKDDTSTKSFISMNRVSKDSYSSNLLLLLLTQKGERLYEPDYGTNLLKFIFEPNDDLTASGVEEEIKNLVSLYIPEIKITSVKFYRLNDDEDNPISENQLNVNVKFVYTEGFLNEVGELNITF
jgi:phage baseplate assembly protein W